MAGRGFRFICSGCSRSQTNQPGYTSCRRCDTDRRNLAKLCGLIRRARPAQARVPDPLLLARMWAAFAAEHHPNDAETLREAQKLVQVLQSREQLELKL